MILSQEDHKYFGRGGLKARGGVDPALIKWLLNLSTPSCSVPQYTRQCLTALQHPAGT